MSLIKKTALLAILEEEYKKQMNYANLKMKLTIDDSITLGFEEKDFVMKPTEGCLWEAENGHVAADFHNIAIASFVVDSDLFKAYKSRNMEGRSAHLNIKVEKDNVVVYEGQGVPYVFHIEDSELEKHILAEGKDLRISAYIKKV